MGEVARALGYLVSGEGEPPEINDWASFAKEARRLRLLPLLDPRAEGLVPSSSCHWG